MGPEDIEHELFHKALLEDTGKFPFMNGSILFFGLLTAESMIILL